MSSSSSSNDEFRKTHTALIKESQIIKDEIKNAKAQKLRLENDLKIAKGIYDASEAAFMNKIKRFSTMLGGNIRTEADLVEKVKILVEQTKEYEERANKLLQDLDDREFSKTQNLTFVDEANQELAEKKRILSERRDVYELLKKKCEGLEHELNVVRQKKDDIFSSLAPIAAAIGISPSDELFFKKLQKRLNSVNPEFEKALVRLSKEAKIPFTGIYDFNPKKFFDGVTKAFNRISTRISEQKGLEDEVLRRLDALRSQVKVKEEKKDKLKANARQLSSQLDRHGKLNTTSTDHEIRQLEDKIQRMNAKQLSAYRRTIDELGGSKLMSDKSTIDDLVDIQARTLIDLARKIVTERHCKEIENKIGEKNRFTHNMVIIENAADCIIRANRKLMDKFARDFR